MSNFNYKPQELDILKGFQGINNSSIIKPTGFATSKNGSLAGFYKFDEEYDHPEYGIYDLNQFNQILNSFKNADVEVTQTTVEVEDTETSSKVSYRTTPVDMGILKEVSDPTKKFEKAPNTVKFTFPSEKIGALRRMGSILGFEKIYFENTENDIKITGSDSKSIKSENIFEETIGETNIETNELEDIYRFSREEFNMIIPGYDYVVEIAINPNGGSCLSRWTNTIISGLYYYVALEKYEG